MKTPYVYDTVSEAIQDLSRRGYTTDFELLGDQECLLCRKTSTELPPEDFEIDETYRFEGSTDPGDEMIVFAISSAKHNLKGIVVNAFGMYADTASSDLVKRLKNHADQPTPIKRHENLKAISREHHHALLLCWKIRTGLKKEIAPQRIGLYTEWFFRQHLKPHFDIEEQFLFPILGMQDAGILKALEQHRQLEQRMTANLDQTENLQALADELDAHIRFEERILFKLIQEKATPEQWELLKTRHREVPFEDLQTDPFWLS